nr:hypothetical protein [Angustibacter aerolatus]
MTAVPTAAAGAVPAHLLPAPSAVRSSIGREAVHDGVGNVVAYNLRFGVRTSGEAPDLDLELADLVTRAFSQFPIERLGGGRRTLLVNLPRAMAVGAVPVPFGPQAVTLHLLGEYDVDDEVLAGLHVLLEQGFRLCVDATVGGDACEQLLPLVHLLRVAVPEPAPEPPELVEYVRGCAPNAQPAGRADPGRRDVRGLPRRGFRPLPGRAADGRSGAQRGRSRRRTLAGGVPAGARLAHRPGVHDGRPPAHRRRRPRPVAAHPRHGQLRQRRRPAGRVAAPGAGAARPPLAQRVGHPRGVRRPLVVPRGHGRRAHPRPHLRACSPRGCSRPPRPPPPTRPAC